MKKLPLIVLSILLLSSCSNALNKDTININNEESLSSFNTKALTVSYLKKKLDKWKKDNNGKKMLRELEYAKFKHIDVLKEVINSQPDSYAYYQGLKSFIEVTSKEGNDVAFKSFLVSLSPDPSSVTALQASNITTTGFTANWSTVTNATGYMLIVDNGTAIDVGNVTSKNITGLSAGSSHSYVVKSVNEAGISEASSSVNLTLKTDAPVASDATNLTQTSFTANWASVNGATSYKLFVDGISVYTGSSTSCNVTSLAIASSHSYYVQAINSSGTSVNSNTVNLTLNPAIAGVPVATSATDVTTTSFTANWTTVTGATSYKLFIDDVEAYSGTNLNFSKTGLTVGSSHSYYVQAINISGASANSNTIDVSTLTSAPVATSATDVTTTSFTANWASVTGATSYKLFIDDIEAYSGTNLNFSKTGLTAGTNHTYYLQGINLSGASANSNVVNVRTVSVAPVASDATNVTNTGFTANWASVTGATSYKLFIDDVEAYSGTNLSFNKTGLTANSAHTYYVQAVNSGGTSASSSTINLNLNPDAPIAPVASDATTITTTSFTANWAASTNASTYTLYVNGTSVYTGTSRSVNVTSLTAGTAYTYYVTATNVTGTSANSNTVNVSTVPVAPVASDTTNVTNTSFTANWSSVTGATSYKLFIDDVEAYSGTNLSFNKTGLTANSAHTYYVKAVNSGGTSANSSTINLNLNPDAPIAPVASDATTVTTTSFIANWASIANASTYTLYVNGTSVYTGTNRSVNVTSLTAGTAYTYYVTATNITGTSANSNAVNVSTVPVAPVASDATTITTTSFTANWAKVTGATSYKLYLDGTPITLGDVSTYSATGLTKGTSHNYYVQAVNSGGSSANSNTISLYTIFDEFRANSYTSASQSYPMIAVNKIDGSFVMAWQSNGQDGNAWGIYGQRYNSDGSVNGSEFRVNSYTTGDQSTPSVAMANDGKFVITWQSNGQDGNGWGVYAQRFNADGSTLGSEFKVNSYTADGQSGAFVSMASDGKFIITWHSNLQDGNGLGIYAQKYNADGSVNGGEFKVNSYTTLDQSEPSVAMASDGKFVITWHSLGQDGDGTYYNIYAQKYNSDGSVNGSEFKVNTYTSNNQWYSSIAMTDTGKFIISWYSMNQDGDLAGYGNIYAQKYNSDGSVNGSEFLVNTYSSNWQGNPSIGMANDGKFVISWYGQGQDDSIGIFAQRYNSDGSVNGSEFRVNSYTTDGQSYPSLAIDNNGRFIITWYSNLQDGSGTGIYAKRYDSNGNTL